MRINFMPRVLALSFLPAVVLASCSERPSGTMVPITVRAPGTSKVDMLVATTRSPVGAPPGELFTGERGEALSFADIGISIPPDQSRKIGEVQWPTPARPDAAKEFVTLNAEILDSGDAIQRFDTRVKRTPTRQVLLFVHGYNTVSG